LARSVDGDDSVGHRKLDRGEHDVVDTRLRVAAVDIGDNAPEVAELNGDGVALSQFRKRSVQLTIDDFGSVYSSLGYLRRYPVDVLKIDREFIDGLGKDPQDAAIISTISPLAHTPGMVVTAEGIETGVQVEQVKMLACDRTQGYFFSQPLNAERADSLLRLTATAHSVPAH
jgi:EAL domain-containing protein (putative c-di-GMP-specific phosphodiesterase class I)